MYFDPFWRVYHTESKRFLGYRLKREFKGFKLEQLDPFRRFSFPTCSESMYWYNRWFESTKDAEAGIIFEARFACYALQHQACYSCHCRSLRWNGGSKASWQDLVCIVCKSTYELKTRATMETIDKNFRKNEIRGGSYSRYRELVNVSKKGPEEKMFMVLLPRQYTYNQNREKCHRVYIAEIDKVLPRVAVTSFNANIKPMRLSSKVSVKLFTKRHWFDLPKTEPIEYTQILENLFIEKFSKEELQRLQKLSKSVDKTETMTPSSGGSEQTLDRTAPSIEEPKIDEVERLKEELQSMKVGDDNVDDWEDMF